MRLGICCALLIFSVACTSRAQATRATSTVISGITVDARNGRGLAGAELKLLKLTSAGPTGLWLQGPPILLGRTVADDGGRFRFATSSRGPFEVSSFHRASRQMGFAQVKRPSERVVVYNTPLHPPPNVKPPPPRR